MPPRHVDLGLIGFGNVARRFVELLLEQRDRLASAYGLTWRIVGIATARHGTILEPSGIDQTLALQAVRAGHNLHLTAASPFGDTLEFIAQCPADVFIETTPLDIEDGQPAIAHVRAALQKGAHVITTNKAPAAFAYDELRDLALARERSFLFEGAVMDGTPLFNLVRETLPCTRIVGFRGILNSTTNYILSRMEQGEDLHSALAAMQEAGIAEANASLDLDGSDAAAKTAALANVLLEAQTTPREIKRRGITDLTVGDMRMALKEERRIRLVARASRSGCDGLEAEVAPMAIPVTDLLATLKGTSNALILTTDLAGELAVVEYDPTLSHTAYALLSDLISVVRRPAAPP